MTEIGARSSSIEQLGRTAAFGIQSPTEFERQQILKTEGV